MSAMSGYFQILVNHLYSCGSNLLGVLIILICSYSAPGAVGHLSFTEILDTSLKVSWSEPSEKNGVLTGTFT